MLKREMKPKREAKSMEGKKETTKPRTQKPRRANPSRGERGSERTEHQKKQQE